MRKILIMFVLSSLVLADMRGPVLKNRLRRGKSKLAVASSKLIQGVILKKTESMLSNNSPLLSSMNAQKKDSPSANTLPKSAGMKATTYFDENAAQGGKRVPAVIDPSEAAKRSEHRNPPGDSGSGPKGIPEKYDRMWPICFFIDPNVPNGNQIVKEVTDMAARCKVNLVAFPFFIQPNYPKNPSALNELAKKSCNAATGMQKLGVSRASVVTLVNNANIPRQMCNAMGMDDANSCAEVGYEVKEGQKARMQATGTWGGQAKPGETAAAIIGPGGFNAATVAGRVQGQSQMAMPFGSGAGNGTGGFGEGYAGAGSSPEKGWSEEGCAEMRKSAFPNTGNFKYLSTQQNYVIQGKKLWDLTKQVVFNQIAVANGAGSPDPNHPGRAALTAGFFDPKPDATGSVASSKPQEIIPNTGHPLRGAGTEGAIASDSTPTKLKIGGQLNSLDNNFMSGTNSSGPAISVKSRLPAQTLAQTLDSAVGTKSAAPSPSASDPKSITIRTPGGSSDSQLDSDYLNTLNNPKAKQDGSATTRGSSLRPTKD